MARDDKYGTITDEHGKIPADEPVFVLRGRDLLAVAAIRFYACTTWARHLSIANKVLGVADEIEAWQQAHPERCKLPD